jgi:hypothetical protein
MNSDPLVLSGEASVQIFVEMKEVVWVLVVAFSSEESCANPNGMSGVYSNDRRRSDSGESQSSYPGFEKAP